MTLVGTDTATYVVQLAIGAGSLLGVLAIVTMASRDNYYFKHGHYPEWGETRVGILPSIMLFLLIVLPLRAEMGPGLFALFLTTMLLYRRSYESKSEQSRRRWRVRFGLLELLLVVLVIGATMGWYIRQQ